MVVRLYQLNLLFWQMHSTI